jgi:hypothetical protein
MCHSANRHAIDQSCAPNTQLSDCQHLRTITLTGTDHGACANATSVSVVLGLSLRRCVPVKHGVAALRWLLSTTAAARPLDEDSARTVLLVCWGVVAGCAGADIAAVADTLLDVWSSFGDVESWGHAGSVAALATSLALLLNSDSAHRGIVIQFITAVLDAEPKDSGGGGGGGGGVTSNDAKKRIVVSAEHAVAWLPALLPCAAAEWVSRLRPDVAAHVVGVVACSSASSLDPALRRALLSALCPMAPDTMGDNRVEMFADVEPS